MTLGIESARKVISNLTGKQVKILYKTGELVKLSGIPILCDSPEKMVLSSYVTFKGDEQGQLMILFSPGADKCLARQIEPGFFHYQADTDESPAAWQELSRGELLNSFVAELANIIGSSILNAMADRAGLMIRPSPPVLIYDMVGAILESALALGLSSSRCVYVSDVKLGFEEGDQVFEIVLIPKTLEQIEPGEGFVGCYPWMSSCW